MPLRYTRAMMQAPRTFTRTSSEGWTRHLSVYTQGGTGHLFFLFHDVLDALGVPRDTDRGVIAPLGELVLDRREGRDPTRHAPASAYFITEAAGLAAAHDFGNTDLVTWLAGEVIPSYRAHLPAAPVPQVTTSTHQGVTTFADHMLRVFIEPDGALHVALADLAAICEVSQAHLCNTVVAGRWYALHGTRTHTDAAGLALLTVPESALAAALPQHSATGYTEWVLSQVIPAARAEFRDRAAPQDPETKSHPHAVTGPVPVTPTGLGEHDQPTVRVNLIGDEPTVRVRSHLLRGDEPTVTIPVISGGYLPPWTAEGTAHYTRPYGQAVPGTHLPQDDVESCLAAMAAMGVPGGGYPQPAAYPTTAPPVPRRDSATPGSWRGRAKGWAAAGRRRR